MLRDYISVAAEVSDMDSLEDLKVIKMAGDLLSLGSTLVRDEVDRSSWIKSIEELMELAQRDIGRRI